VGVSEELGGQLLEGHFMVSKILGHTYGGAAGELFLHVQWGGECAATGDLGAVGAS